MQYLQTRSINEEKEEPLYYNFTIAKIKNHDIMTYAIYETGSIESFSDEKLQEMQVLSSLYKLGFPVDEEGTYLYKSMIMKALHHLDGFDDIGHPITEDELLNQMQSKFSQFYLDVARNDLDIGIKTFHAYIKQALNSVDYACVDPNVLSDIYGDFSEEADYGKHAFVIAKRIHERSKIAQTSTSEEAGHQYVKAIATATE